MIPKSQLLTLISFNFLAKVGCDLLWLYLLCRALEEGVSPCRSCSFHGLILKLMLHLKAFTRRVLHHVCLLATGQDVTWACQNSVRQECVLFPWEAWQSHVEGKAEVILQGREGEYYYKQKYRSFPAICHHMLDWTIFLNPPGVNLQQPLPTIWNLLNGYSSEFK